MIKRKAVIHVLPAFFVVFACAISTPATAASPDYWPTDGWRTSTPEEHMGNGSPDL